MRANVNYAYMCVRARARICMRACVVVCEHAREWVGLIMGLGDFAALPAQPIITII